MRAHQREVKWQCKKCEKSFDAKCLLKTHLTKNHETQMVFDCDFCGKSFTQKYSMERHRLSHLKSKEMKFKCDKCDLAFEKQIQVLRHKLSNHNDLRCDKCDKKFTKVKCFQRHVRRIHEGIKKIFKCESCDKMFGDNYQLKVHFDSVHEGWRHFCKMCGKSYSSLGGFTRHTKLSHSKDNLKKTHPEIRKNKMVEKKTDSKEKRFQCDNCDKVYGYKHQLKNHFDSVHEGWKHFCNLCGKSFSFKQSLQRHRKDHKLRKEGITFKCNSCLKVFITKDSLSTHIRKTHPELRKSSTLSKSQKSQEEIPSISKDCDPPMKRGSWIVQLERIDTSEY